MRKLFLCVVLIGLAGCGDDTIIMRKPGQGQDAEWRKDDYDCVKDAYAMGDVRTSPYGSRRDPNWGLHQSCMEARGYARKKN